MGILDKYEKEYKKTQTEKKDDFVTFMKEMHDYELLE